MMKTTKENFLQKWGRVAIVIVLIYILVKMRAPVWLLLIGFGILYFLIRRKDDKRRYLTLDEKVEAFRRSNNCCEECGSTRHLSIHHIVPLSRGGTNHTRNLTILCRRCNSRIGNRC